MMKAALALTTLADGERGTKLDAAQRKGAESLRKSDEYLDDFTYINGEPILCPSC